jgi:diadenosine tetraphosphatase ApaH/serine/threonine PP2A family protein phosphatase
MKRALFADVHSNLEAITACLAHARGQGADAYAFLGDLVGYGADPEAVLDIVEGLAREGAVVVRGNHDTAVLDGDTEAMDSAAADAIAWTRERVVGARRDFLARLPLVARSADAAFVHASAASPDQWTYVTDSLGAAQSLEAAGVTYVFSGHVHVPALYYTGSTGRPLHFAPVPGVPIPVPGHRRWLAIVGSAGQPRDGKTAACYALFDAQRETLTFFRVPYDWRTAAAKVRAAGLPARLALRLEQGK